MIGPAYNQEHLDRLWYNFTVPMEKLFNIFSSTQCNGNHFWLQTLYTPFTNNTKLKFWYLKDAQTSERKRSCQIWVHESLLQLNLYLYGSTMPLASNKYIFPVVLFWVVPAQPRTDKAASVLKKLALMSSTEHHCEGWSQLMPTH